MSKLPNCEKDSLKSFINILRSYGLDQQRVSNIVVAKNVRSETQVLTYHLEQGGHFTIAKEELQALKVDQQNLDITITKEDLEKLNIKEQILVLLKIKYKLKV
jgi:hypothetical protein